MSLIVESSRVVSSPSPQESSVLRYHRVAHLEAILSIRERQQRRTRLLVLWLAVLLISGLGVAAVFDWL